MAECNWTLEVDLDRCIGCWACAIACKMKNGLPPGVWWVRVDTIGGDQVDVSSGEFPAQQKQYKPVIERCNFGEEQAAGGELPDCMKACPVGVFRFGPGELGTAPLGGRFSVHYLPGRRVQRRSGWVV